MDRGRSSHVYRWSCRYRWCRISYSLLNGVKLFTRFAFDPCLRKGRGIAVISDKMGEWAGHLYLGIVTAVCSAAVSILGTKCQRGRNFIGHSQHAFDVRCEGMKQTTKKRTSIWWSRGGWHTATCVLAPAAGILWPRYVWAAEATADTGSKHYETCIEQRFSFKVSCAECCTHS